MIEPAAHPKPIPTFREAVDQQKLLAAATEFYRNDHRARALVDSCVAMAQTDFGAIDPEYPDRDAHYLALQAALLMLTRIYTEDAEVAALRAERDHYRELALNSLRFSIPPQRILSDSDTHPAGQDAAERLGS